MPIKYIPFIPEPIEGQAVLGNFNRILKYKGADDVSMVLQRGMPLYEMEEQETVGENPDGNLVIRGECVSACAYLKDQGIQVDLVYIDPPFASGADYAKKVYIRRNPKVAEAIAQAEQELDIDELKAFEEKMYGDVWDKEKYLSWMYENLMAIKSVMSETASIYVHLDFHVGHYVKILLDEIFGEDNYQNDIYWYYYNKFDDVADELLQHPVCIYAKPSGVEANFAVDLIRPEAIITHQNMQVTMNGEVLYDQIDIIRKPGNIKSFQLGPGIIGTISQNKLNFQYHSCDTLQEQIRQLRLFTALMRGEPVEIGPLVLPYADFKLTGHTQQEMEQRLSWLQTIARVLKQLHVNKDLNLSKMTDEEYQKLRNVVIGIDKGVPVPFSFDGVLAYGKIEFGGISVLLNLKKSEDGKGVYLSNFFDMENLKMTAEAGQSPDDGFAISPYILMDATLLSELDNVDLNEIVPSVEKQPYSAPYGDKIIGLSLELLKLYDQNKNAEILDICLELLSFVGKDPDIPKEIITINCLQTEKRRRALTAEEKKYLFTLKKSEGNISYQFAASILLESFQEADLIYEQMSEEERKLFDGYPIENLWKN